jgi:hypothetical protein
LTSRRDALVWVFAHRFHAEFNVAALLAPFLLAAPDYELQLLLATQVADEHRHIESVLRVYSDVFAVEGGIAVVKALADAQLDPVAAALYAALDEVVRALEASRDEDSFLKAVVAYHLIGEGSIGRANQNFVAAQFDRVGSFPGLREAQRLAVRDEVRHIGIGVSYARRRLTRDGARARALIEDIVQGFQALGDNLLEHAAPACSTISSLPTAPSPRRSGPRCCTSYPSASARSASTHRELGTDWTSRSARRSLRRGARTRSFLQIDGIEREKLRRSVLESTTETSTSA